MLSNVVNGAQVRGWMDEKKELEIRLAYDLLDIFNSDELLLPLRKMAAAALEEVKAVKAASPLAAAKIRSIWQSQVGIVPLCGKYALGFNQVAPDQLDAADCSDLIRIFGDCVEKVIEMHSPVIAQQVPAWVAADQARRELRVGPERWAEDDRGGAGRLRIKNPDPAPMPHGLAHRFLKQMQGGISIITLKDSSTIKRIDQVFGFVEGADISGTTADSIAFMNRFLRATDGDPMYYLLPLGTIVGLGHHSIIEVALPLSMNDFVDYRIGFYTTLLPAGAQRALGPVRSKLTAAEMSPGNRMMLVYYARGAGVATPYAPAGCFLYEDNDRRDFWDFANSVDVLDTFPWMPTWPNEEQLRDYCGARRLRTP